MDYVYYEDGLGDVDAFNCPCVLLASFNFHSLPFVGANYYCESGGVNLLNFSAYYFNGPLWDGSGCITSNCYDNPTQPWFYTDS